MTPLIYTALTANLIGFFQMALDKRLAANGKRRISELQLILPTLFGGLIGIVLGMLAFRHKTVKRSFQLKLTVAFILFAAGMYLLYFEA